MDMANNLIHPRIPLSIADGHLKSHRAFPPSRGAVKEPTLVSSSVGPYQTVNAPNHSPLLPPTGLNLQAAGLPPTPPSTNSQELSSAPENTSFANGDLDTATIISSRPPLSTPINQRSPPTPDPSPPRGLNLMRSPLPAPTLRYPSSRAESFKTAREDQWSTNSDASQSQLSLDAGLTSERSIASAKGVANSALGPQFNLESDNITPTERNSTPSLNAMPRKTKSIDLGVDDQASNVPNREWNTDLMRNVTVHRKGRLRTPQHQGSVSSPQASPPSPLQSDLSTHRRFERVKERSRVPSSDNDNGFQWPKEVNSMLNDHIRDGEGKRNSTASSISTVVEAVVLITPPRRRQTLRHARTNLALRGPDESPPVSPLISRSNRASVASDDVPLHKLVHKRSRIPDRRNRDSIGSDMSVHSTPARIAATAPKMDANATPAHVIPKSKFESKQQDVSIRPRAVSTPVQNLYPSPAGTDRGSKGYFDLSRNKKEDEFDAAPPLFQYVTPYSPKEYPKLQKSRVVSDPVRTIPISPQKAPGITPPHAMTLLPSNPKKASRFEGDEKSSITMESSQRSRETPSAVIPSGEPQNSPSKGGSSFLDSPAPSESRTPIHGDHSFLDSPAPSETGRSPLPTDVPFNFPESPRRNKRVSLALTEDISRRSFDEGGFRADDTKRTSMASSARTDEHANARHLFAQNTPYSFSQFSATPEVEVSEATTVNIYPHNNHSLLVVQQVSRSNHTSQQETPRLAMNQTRPLAPLQPTLMLEPSTPPQKSSSSFSVDSPLRNPRKPPIPPVLAVIPPTPADELDRQLVGPTEQQVRLNRATSLRERARRYSDNFIAPILARAPTKARRTASNPPVRRVPSVTKDDGNLHPLWRPRGVLDDYDSSFDSDDDSDSSDFLPQGGDTSELPNHGRRPLLGRRLTNGFKGSGGFLIGNSLGLNRHGTNKRRHHVSVPANFGTTWRRPGNARFQTTHPALNPLGRVEKRMVHSPSSRSLSSVSHKISRWRRMHKIPGLGMHIQYVGLRGVKEKLSEKRAEKRRQTLRQNIGPRFLVGDSRVG